MRKALVNKAGLIVNVIEIEEETDWKPPKGWKLLSEEQSATANPGDSWDGKNIIPKESPESALVVRDIPVELDDIKERVNDLETRIGKLEV